MKIKLSQQEAHILVQRMLQEQAPTVNGEPLKVELEIMPDITTGIVPAHSREQFSSLLQQFEGDLRSVHTFGLIPPIKTLRTMTGFGLWESKVFVEKIRDLLYGKGVTPQ